MADDKASVSSGVVKNTESVVPLHRTETEHDDKSSDSYVADDEIDEDKCEFFDAESYADMGKVYELDLNSTLEEAKLAIDYFFNNKFDEARALMRPLATTSMYHSMGNAVFIFLEAILTFEQKHIANAGEALRGCLEVCQRYRKRSTFPQSIGKSFKKSNYNNLTDLESHAELCSAETLLLKALLTFIEDETFTSFIRGGIKIRQCYGSYKECAQILKQREWQSKTSRAHFESGVRMGIGTFNLMVSLLPNRIIKLLEFIGFSGNKTQGLEDLEAGFQLFGLRQVLCALVLLGYHLIVCYVLSYQEGDLQLCNGILEQQLKEYPNGVWFLFFKGRLEFMRGNLNEAQQWYIKSWKSQSIWPQFHHLSFWELLWLNCLKLDWREASVYATHLIEHSKWSRTIYSYQKAAILLMLTDLTSTEREAIDKLMLDAPKYKQRIAGKSLPMEKFICKKVNRYFEQDHTLCLPAIELMYLWNTFKVLSKSYQIAEHIYLLIDRELHKMDASQDAQTTVHPYVADNRALCLLLRAACYRQMSKSYLALQDIEECLSLQHSVKEDMYLMAYASVESALIHADENRIKEAIFILEETKKKYNGYSLESRLHFRIHSALMELKEKLN